MDMMDELERDSDALIPSDTGLTKVASLAKRQAELENEIENIESHLADRKEALRVIQEVSLPQAMQECGLTKFTTVDGYVIDVKPFYSAKIGEDNQVECFSWLRNHGHDDIIKNEIKTSFGRGEDAVAKVVISSLQTIGVPFTQKTSVHPQTLTAFVREQVESGSDFPLDTFKVFIGQKAKIKRSK